MNTKWELIKFFTFLAMFPFSSFAQVNTETYGKWQTVHDKEGKTWIAATKSEKYDGAYFGLMFHPSASCKPIIQYSVPSKEAPNRQKDGPYMKTVKLRVDSKSTHVVNKGEARLVSGLSVDKMNALATLYIPIDDLLITELVNGKKLRMLVVESDVTERFDLNGSKVAIAMARLGCGEESPQSQEIPENEGSKGLPLKAVSYSAAQK